LVKLSDDENLKEMLDALRLADKALRSITKLLGDRCPAAIPHLEAGSAAADAAARAITQKVSEDHPEDFVQQPGGKFILRNPPGSNVVTFRSPQGQRSI
jgi:hypothetical protein